MRSDRLAVIIRCMATNHSSPVVHDAWLGPLWRHGDHELIGSISIDPTVRPARHNGATDAEVLLDIGPTTPEPELSARVSLAAARIRAALANLDQIQQFAVDHAPADWRRYYQAQGATPLIERLFLDGFEVSQALDVAACFDFGDLDMLIVKVDSSSRGISVELRP